MVDLKAQLALDAVKVFANADEFAESITYYPAGVIGDPRVFDAVVDRRDEVEDLGVTEGDVLTLEAVIAIPNSTDVTKGLTSIDVRKDLVDVVLIQGEAATRCRVIRRFSSDEGMHEIGVVK